MRERLRVLVTGGSGFIGSYVVSRLRETSGLEIDVLGQGDMAGIRLGNRMPLLEALAKFPAYDVVVNLAAYIGNEPEEVVTSNFHGIHDILDYCNHSKTGQLIHLSRSFAVRRPTPDYSSRLGRLYEYSKQYAELLLEKHSQVPTSIFRITAPVWTSMPIERYLSQILIAIAKGEKVKILGRGLRVQNYVRLDNIADAIIASMRPPFCMSSQRYMVCGPENFTDFRFAEAVHERLGVPFSYTYVSAENKTIVDESDYGIDSVESCNPALGIETKALDTKYLKEHLAVILAKLGLKVAR